MGTINFVPDDYIEQRQSSRVNLLYLMLLMAMLGAIGITFGFIKMQQRKVASELNVLNTRMDDAKQQIAQLEELKTKRKTMMKTMVMTSELLEPIPRSVVLASLTNDLPGGVSLIELELQTEEIHKKIPRSESNSASGSKYNSKAAGAEAAESQVTVETNLTLKGIAPSDIQVASYIANLSQSILLDNVELVESRELDIENIKFREFELKAIIKPNLTLTKQDINKIREKAKETI